MPGVGLFLPSIGQIRKPERENSNEEGWHPDGNRYNDIG